jgi:hypothetical protein
MSKDLPRDAIGQCKEQRRHVYLHWALINDVTIAKREAAHIFEQ